jgi:hypothetical protein
VDDEFIHSKFVKFNFNFFKIEPTGETQNQNWSNKPGKAINVMSDATIAIVPYGRLSHFLLTIIIIWNKNLTSNL